MAIRRFFQNNNVNKVSLEDQENMLAELPAALRGEIVSYTHGAIIKGIIFFQEKSTDFQWKVLKNLQQFRITAGDTLYSEGDYAEESNVKVHLLL